MNEINRINPIQDIPGQAHTYKVGNINFIVTPVYRTNGQGETMSDILLKLMKADTERKKQ